MPYKQDFSSFKLWTLRIPCCTAIGWLEPEYSYSHGAVKESFVEKLSSLLVDTWQPFTSWGSHDCGFCNPPKVPSPLRFKDHLIQLGKGELCVPYESKIFVSPRSIVHYISSHDYCPPPEYQEAVMQCPAMNSEAYFRALLKTPIKCYVSPKFTAFN